MRKYVLVTGASSGIGESACMALVEKGYDVIAGVRTPSDAARLAEGGKKAIHPVIMDVTDADVMESAKTTAESIIGDGALVAIFNNAGIVVSGAVLYIPIEEWQRQFDVNVIGLLRTTTLFFSLLSKQRQTGDDHPRRIINMSSVSGLFASPFMGPYAASKYAVEALSDSLRRELYMYDIQVVLIEPGNIVTPIWEKAKKAPSYFGPEYNSILEFKERMIDKMITSGTPVKVVDEVILRAVMSPKVKSRYLIRREKWKFNLITKMPASWVDRLIRKNLVAKSGIRPF
jgi:NAD(P)-dependent dehydrogenase (short-subunit alcohol dehydrogenase family)